MRLRVATSCVRWLTACTAQTLKIGPVAASRATTGRDTSGRVPATVRTTVSEISLASVRSVAVPLSKLDGQAPSAGDAGEDQGSGTPSTKATAVPPPLPVHAVLRSPRPADDGGDNGASPRSTTVVTAMTPSARRVSSVDTPGTGSKGAAAIDTAARQSVPHPVPPSPTMPPTGWDATPTGYELAGLTAQF